MFNESKETRDEYIMRRYVGEGAGCTTIGKEMGVSEQAVAKRIKKLGIQRSKDQKIFESDHLNVCAMYKDGMSANKIATGFNLKGPETVLRILKENNIPIR